MAEIVNRLVRLAACRPHPQNYNRHDAGQIADLRRSLRAFGQVRSIVVQAAGADSCLIVAGHGLVAAAQAEGWTELRADVVPAAWPAAKVLAYLAADNELARRGDPDEGQLAALVAQVAAEADANLASLAAGNEARMQEMLAGLAQGTPEDPGAQLDKAEELQAKWGTASGQLWACGEHRIICGDSLASDRRGDCLALIFDPEWDAMPDAMTGFDSVLAFCDGATLGAVTERYGAPTWVFAWDCVTSWYTPKRPLRRMKLCAWYGDIAKYDFDGWHYGDAGEARDVQNTRGEYRFVPDPRGKHLADVYAEQITKTHAEHLHSHGKPIDWVTLLIGNCTTGDVYDPFCGSGTSLIACEKLKRKCRAVEINPAFVAVTLDRWSQMTGRMPVLEH